MAENNKDVTYNLKVKIDPAAAGEIKNLKDKISFDGPLQFGGQGGVHNVNPSIQGRGPAGGPAPQRYTFDGSSSPYTVAPVPPGPPSVHTQNPSMTGRDPWWVNTDHQHRHRSGGVPTFAQDLVGTSRSTGGGLSGGHGLMGWGHHRVQELRSWSHSIGEGGSEKMKERVEGIKQLGEGFESATKSLVALGLMSEETEKKLTRLGLSGFAAINAMKSAAQIGQGALTLAGYPGAGSAMGAALMTPLGGAAAGALAGTVGGIAGLGYTAYQSSRFGFMGGSAVGSAGDRYGSMWANSALLSSLSGQSQSGFSAISEGRERGERMAGGVGMSALIAPTYGKQRELQLAAANRERFAYSSGNPELYQSPGARQLGDTALEQRAFDVERRSTARGFRNDQEGRAISETREARIAYQMAEGYNEAVKYRAAQDSEKNAPKIRQLGEELTADTTARNTTGRTAANWLRWAMVPSWERDKDPNRIPDNQRSRTGRTYYYDTMTPTERAGKESELENLIAAGQRTGNSTQGQRDAYGQSLRIKGQTFRETIQDNIEDARADFDYHQGRFNTISGQRHSMLYNMANRPGEQESMDTRYKAVMDDPSKANIYELQQVHKFAFLPDQEKIQLEIEKRNGKGWTADRGAQFRDEAQKEAKAASDAEEAEKVRLRKVMEAVNAALIKLAEEGKDIELGEETKKFLRSVLRPAGSAKSLEAPVAAKD